MKKYDISEPFMSNLSEEKVIKVSLPNWKYLIVNESDYSKIDKTKIEKAIEITDKSDKEYLYISSIEI